MDSDIFRLELSKFLNKFDAYSKSYFAKKIKETKKYSPVVSDFYKKLEDFSQGGKKLRAFFVWLGYQVGTEGPFDFAQGKLRNKVLEDIEKILSISLAFEMTQNFLLIHDDIMDNSDLRRSKPTVHKVYEKKFGPSTLRARQHYGESMAITLGDIASMEAFRIIADSDFDNQRKVEAQRLFAEVLLETAYGQGLDVEYANREPSFRRLRKFCLKQLMVKV
ncbi:polyprenyl synthetase family protein [Candidatus Curtissbacteria bacterium]|nr:polyprenyl synthetase family protein [Candidatus Curtissbacteria bacterium]